MVPHGLPRRRESCSAPAPAPRSRRVLAEYGPSGAYQQNMDRARPAAHSAWTADKRVLSLYTVYVPNTDCAWHRSSRRSMGHEHEGEHWLRRHQRLESISASAWASARPHEGEHSIRRHHCDASYKPQASSRPDPSPLATANWTHQCRACPAVGAVGHLASRYRSRGVLESRYGGGSRPQTCPSAQTPNSSSHQFAFERAIPHHPIGHKTTHALDGQGYSR